MSAEVVKKRGRPKKVVIPELIEVKVPAPVKKVTQTKSTKAMLKTAPAKADTATKTPMPMKTPTKAAPTPNISPLKAASPTNAKTEAPVKLQEKASIEASQLEAQSAVGKDFGNATNTSITASEGELSPILAEVQKLKEKNVLAETRKSNTESTVEYIPAQEPLIFAIGCTPWTPVEQPGLQSSIMISAGNSTNVPKPVPSSLPPIASLSPDPKSPASPITDASEPADFDPKALRELQTQMVLLEQQHEKRLMMAGQDQENESTPSPISAKNPPGAAWQPASKRFQDSVRKMQGEKRILDKQTAPAPSSTPPSEKSPPSKPPGKPHVPLAAINSDIVSNISTRAGARPNAARSKQLPQNYKQVSRKVTMAIVALPIAIVTSYVLYQRLVLGEEKKTLMPPIKPSPPSTDADISGSASS